MIIPKSAHAIFDRNEAVFLKSFKKEDLKFKDPSGRTLLATAIIENLPKVISFLSKFDEVLTIPDKKGLQPLHLCALNNDVTTAKLLVNKGVDIDAKDYFGNSPLWRATFNTNYQLVKILIESGANPYLRNNSDISALNFATEIEDEQLIKILLESSVVPPDKS